MRKYIVVLENKFPARLRPGAILKYLVMLEQKYVLPQRKKQVDFELHEHPSKLS